MDLLVIRFLVLVTETLKWRSSYSRNTTDICLCQLLLTGGREDQMRSGSKKQTPPSWAEWLIMKLSWSSDREGIVENLREEYRVRSRMNGEWETSMWYCLQAVRSVLPFVGFELRWRIVMLKSYLKIAFRNMTRQKLYTGINIGGLAIGIAASLIIILFVMNELSFDRFHENADRIYRIGNQVGSAADNRGAFTPPPLASALKNDFPEVMEATRLNLWKRERLVRYKEKQYIENDIIHADSTVFNIFTFNWIAGTPRNALVQPHQVVITEEMAEKYFGDEEPVGRILEFEDQDVIVCGVVEAFPKNSHFQFDFIVSLVSLDSHDDQTWMSNCFFTYLLLPHGYSPEHLEAKLPDFILKHYGPIFLQETGVDYGEYLRDENNHYGYWLQPLLDIHLNNNIFYLTESRGSRQTMFNSSVAQIRMASRKIWAGAPMIHHRHLSLYCVW